MIKAPWPKLRGWNFVFFVVGVFVAVLALIINETFGGIIQETIMKTIDLIERVSAPFKVAIPSWEGYEEYATAQK